MGSATFLFNEHVPLVPIDRREFNLHNKHFGNKSLLTSIKIRDNLFVNTSLSSLGTPKGVFTRDIHFTAIESFFFLILLSKKLHYYIQQVPGTATRPYQHL